MQTLLFVLMFLVFTYQVEGWGFFRRIRLPPIRVSPTRVPGLRGIRVVPRGIRVPRGIKIDTTKNCFCKAVEADTHRTLHDFHSIQHCTGLFGCGCRSSAMITCGDECDRKVTNWLKSNRSRCTFARTLYTASTCGVPSYGHNRKPC